jgi:archaellum component FlaC/surface antigen
MTENFKDSARLLVSYLLPLSLFSLAGAIVYFTYEVAIVSKQIPDILLSIENTSEKIEPIIDEVGDIIELVPPILKEVEEIRKLIPPILKEVEQTRKMIPPILNEVEQTRNQIPAVLKESEAIRGELPAVLASADKASDAVAGVSKQVEATRPLISEVLKEVETTRESIPPMMDRADGLIEKARVAGKEASQGAVTGIFSGIIMAPFALVADMGRGITGLSAEEAKHFDEKDFELIEQVSFYLLDNGSKGEERQWNNAETGSRGIVKLTEIYTEGEYSEFDCRTLTFKLYKNDDLIRESSRSFCKNEDDKWDFKDDKWDFDE